MITWLFFLLSILIGQQETTSSGPNVDITPANRVPNKTGQQCVWASLETQARHWGISQLYDLTDKYKEVCNPEVALQVLVIRGVDYHWQPEGQHRWSVLERTSKAHRPVAVVIAGENWSHMLLVIDVNKTHVMTLDNDFEFTERRWTRAEFDKVWNGWQISIDPLPWSGTIGPKAQKLKKKGVKIK